MLRLLLTALALARPQSSASAEPPGPGAGGPSDAFRPVGRVPYDWPLPYTTTTTTGESRDVVQRQMDNLYNILQWLRPPPMARPPMVLLTLAQSTMAQPVMIKQPVVQPAMAEPVKTQQDQPSTPRLTKRQLEKEADPNADEWYKGKKKRTTVLAPRSANV